MNQVQRFWEKVRKGEGCWEWKGATDSSGRASFIFNGRCSSAARASWEIHFGYAPGKFYVCHICGNRICVNPGHLFLGTQFDNVQDMIKKNRKAPAHGAHNGNARLNEEDVRAIYLSQERSVVLAEAYGVNRNSIIRIKSRKTWAEVTQSLVTVPKKESVRFTSQGGLL